MTEVNVYNLPRTTLIPNSPWPLLHYPQFFAKEPGCITVKAYDLFSCNGWQVQWIFRYGETQSAHECMVVLSGSAIIRFGAADTDDDLEKNTHGPSKEAGGVEIHAEVGDVFVIPAGVSHKTFDTSPAATFASLTPGDGHRVESTDARQALADVELSGFSMLGAYPEGSEWDFMRGGETAVDYEEVWRVGRPDKDPVLSYDVDGICGRWDIRGAVTSQLDGS